MNHEKPIFGGSFWMARSWGLHLDQEKHLNTSSSSHRRGCVLEATRLTSQVGDTGDGPVSVHVHPQNEGCSFVASTLVPSHPIDGEPEPDVKNRHQDLCIRLLSDSPNMSKYVQIPKSHACPACPHVFCWHLLTNELFHDPFHEFRHDLRNPQRAIPAESQDFTNLNQDKTIISWRCDTRSFCRYFLQIPLISIPIKV